MNEMSMEQYLKQIMESEHSIRVEVEPAFYFSLELEEPSGDEHE